MVAVTVVVVVTVLETDEEAVAVEIAAEDTVVTDVAAVMVADVTKLHPLCLDDQL